MSECVREQSNEGEEETHTGGNDKITVMFSTEQENIYTVLK